MERHPALDCFDIEAQFAIRRQTSIPVDYERRWTRVQSSLRFRCSGCRFDGLSCQSLAIGSSEIPLPGRCHDAVMVNTCCWCCCCVSRWLATLSIHFTMRVLARIDRRVDFLTLDFESAGRFRRTTHSFWHWIHALAKAVKQKSITWNTYKPSSVWMQHVVARWRCSWLRPWAQGNNRITDTWCWHFTLNSSTPVLYKRRN